MVIALVASLIRNPFINRLVSVTAWTIAALSILGLLDDTVAALDARAIVIGGLRVTPLLVLKTAVLLAVALWAATATSNFLDRRVQHVAGLTPSIQVLLGKLIRIGVMTVAIVIVLSAVGIDLSVLAVFTGAIGVGVGLGMQKIVVELRQRHHPAGRQVDQAGRRHHRRRPFRLGRQHGRALHLGRS